MASLLLTLLGYVTSDSAGFRYGSSLKPRYQRLNAYMLEITLSPRRLALTFSVAVALCASCAAQQPVDQVVQSANKFLETLSEAKRFTTSIRNTTLHVPGGVSR
jgi:hypothetical protein